MLDDAPALDTRLTDAGLDTWAADNLASYLREQRTATGRLPDERTVVVERFRDELGDWRVVVHSPWGAKVHAPWALVLAGRLRERYGIDAAAMHSDDGIVLRLPDTGAGWESVPGAAADDPEAPSEAPGTLTSDDLVIDPDDVLEAVRSELAASVMFSARFREAAARALLLPRRRPDRRQPLWQQRQRASQLLEVASTYPEFPIVLEAARECLQDDFDVAALTELMRGLAAGDVRLVEVETSSPSPFAQSLLFGYTAQFLYDGDAPLAERRAAALALDPTLLAELLGTTDAASQLADLLDPDAIERTEAELGLLTDERRARHAEDVVDVLRRTGPLPASELAARVRPEARDDLDGWLADLEASRRVISIRLAGVPPEAAQQWAVVEDAGRLRDALGVALPVGVPEIFTEPVVDPLGDLARRHARTHGPFAAARLAERFGLGTAVAAEVLRRLETARVLVSGRLRPESLGGTGEEWCDAEVLRTLRRRSLAALRSEVEPVVQETLGVFAPDWHQIGHLRGTDGLLRAVEQLSGAVVPASALETLVLPSRVTDYTPAMLDELTTTGEVLWAGHAALPGSGGGDGYVSLHLADAAPLTLAAPSDLTDGGPLDTDLHRTVLALLEDSGGYFLARLAERAEATGPATLDVLWDLVWAGRVTNDGLGALRERLGAKGGSHRAARAPARARPLRRSRFGTLPGPQRQAAVRGGGGRWSALPPVEQDQTRRTAALTRVLLDRHGILTRGSAHAESVPDYFRGVYRALGALEQAGSVRRGYFVEHLGASQFALPGAVDRLRTVAADRDRARERRLAQSSSPTTGPAGLVLAATDPANPFGAALGWPRARGAERGAGHRPGRKPGALVVLVEGELVLYVERGGRSVLTFPADGHRGQEDPSAALQAAGAASNVMPAARPADRAPSEGERHVVVDEPAEHAMLVAAARALAEAVAAGRAGPTTVMRVDGEEALAAAGRTRPHGPVAALVAAGFTPTPRGLRLRR
ncbi:hypothetical protein GCM10025865_31860 [Paraoerskovia sediminicola]|uniref:DEAD/H associated domain-containing protein n=1 Tax=Paraoerskovia sediminicola TaxID=1138587 RepID=A0ABM8G6V1_9CELL|nr:hypothetical protein GCM10025865_31860 [Paraoerskovia sediminicola]